MPQDIVIDDPTKQLRQFCTCPVCDVVWLHKEWGQLQVAWQDAQARYGGRVICPECGAISEPSTRQNAKWLKRTFTTWRTLVQKPQGSRRNTGEDR